MNFLSYIIGNEIFLIPLFGFAIFVLAYSLADKVYAFLYKKTVGSREEILELLDKMYVDIEEKKLTMLLVLVSFGLGFAVFLLTWPHLLVGFFIGSIVVIAGWVLPKLFVNMAWDRRCNQLTDQMVDGLTIMGNSVKAGQSLTQALERVVENTTGPLAQEFNLILNKIRLGMAVEEALNEFGERIPRPDVQMFVTSVNILKETGGNLAETFQTIVLTIRERQKVEKKIQALTAQGTMQAVIISLVPFVLMVVFLMVDPNYIMPLFTRPLGWFILVVMLGLQTIGLVVMKKIVSIKV